MLYFLFGFIALMRLYHWISVDLILCYDVGIICLQGFVLCVQSAI